MENKTRKKLLAAAAAEFAQHGLRHATIRGICSRAEANIAAVSYHFGDKKGLYRAVCERLFPKGADLTLPKPAAVTDADSFELAVTDWVETFIGRVVRNRQDDTLQLIQVTIHEMSEPSADMNMLYRLYLARPLNALKSIVGKALAQPSDSVEVQVRVFEFLGAFLFYFHHRNILSLESGDSAFFRKNWEKIFEILLEDFIHNVECSESFIWKR